MNSRLSSSPSRTPGSVCVLDRGGDTRLGLEGLAEHRVPGVLRGDQLDGDGPLERELGGAVDDAHTA
jgi:hypothetical protein